MGSPDLGNLLYKITQQIIENEQHPELITENLVSKLRDVFDDYYVFDSLPTSSMPLVAIMDPEETDSYRDGVYIAILFEGTDNVEQVTLTLIQGVSSVSRETQTPKDVLSERSRNLRAELSAPGFAAGSPSLPAAQRIQELYAPASIFHKQYSAEELQENQDISTDFETLSSTYKQYVGREGEGPDASSTVELLHVGPCYISRNNFTAARRREFTKAFDDAVSVAIDTDVDAVVQTGELLGTQKPNSECLRHVENSLDRLQQHNIPCYHVPDERDAKLDAVDELYERGLLHQLGPEPSLVSDVALFGKHPDQSYTNVLGSVRLPEGANNGIVAGYQPVAPPIESSDSADLTTLVSEQETPIDAVLVGSSDGPEMYQDEIAVFASGPTEPVLTKSLIFSDHRPDPFPRSVSTVRITPDQITQSLTELPHRPFIVIAVQTNETVDVSRLVDEISSVEYSDAVVAVRIHCDTDSAEISRRINDQLADETFASRVWVEESNDVPSEGFDITVDRCTWTTGSTGQRLHIYHSQDIGTRSYTQEAFTHELLGEESKREIARGDTVLLHDTGEHEKADEALYGPLTVRSTVTENLTPDAWNGALPYQIEIGWNQLYFADPDTMSSSFTDTDTVHGDAVEDYLSELKQTGTTVDVSENGIPQTPPDIDADDPVASPETGTEGTGETGESLTTIIKYRDSSEPLTLGTAVENARQPGVAIIQGAVDGELRPDLYRQALCHLVSGKNLIFYGPPGSGKTRLAKRLSHAICSETLIETANAEWTYQEVVGGFQPVGDSFEPQPGSLTQAAERCEHSLEQHSHPSWLLIDELNRANLDQAFGEVFTLLDIDHRSESHLSFGNKRTHGDRATQAVPLAFRILGTMNTEDQAQMFALGYAFRRRFSFVKVPPLQSPRPTFESTGPTVPSIPLRKQSRRARQIIQKEVRSYFAEHEPSPDSKYAIPSLAEVVFTQDDLCEEVLRTVGPGDIQFDAAILSFVETVTEEQIAEIGQGIIIDAIKYIVTAYALFPDETGWKTVDEAVMSYILPQLESYMAELRRADTIVSESGGDQPFQNLIDKAGTLGFGQTKQRLERATDTHQIIS